MSTIFLGRFQPFHQGHFEVIENYREEESLKIVVGSAEESRTEENPLNFDERVEIIQQCFPDLEILGISDEERSEEGNKKWISKLESETDADKIITQNDLVKDLAREYTGLEVIEQDLREKEIYSGTEIRRRIKSGEEWRYLVPDCAVEHIENVSEIIRKSGIEYEFEPGWKKKNAYNNSLE